MCFKRSNFNSIILVIVFAVMFSVTGVHATVDDYSICSQEKFSDLINGTFTNTTVNPENNTILLKKIDHSNEYYASGEFITPPFKTDKAFDAIFLSWMDKLNKDENIKVFIRLGDKKKRFGEWIEVNKEDEMIFEVTYNYLQYKVEMSTGSQKTTPELKSMAIYYADLYDKMKNIDYKTLEYAVKATKPEIIEREEWGAVKPTSSYASQVVKSIIIHHSYIPNVSQYKGAASIRGIQHYHMTSPDTGWSDIGYHFLIGPDGVIYRGRPENARGAHCVPNSNKIGICCIGDYDPGKDKLPAKLYASLTKLVNYLASKHKVSKKYLYGHRDFSPKTCPGETVYKKLPELKNGMQKLFELKK